MKFFCVQCGQKMAAPTLYGGRMVRCPSCGNEQAIPLGKTAVPEPPPAPPAADHEFSIGFQHRESADASAARPDRDAAHPKQGQAGPHIILTAPRPNVPPEHKLYAIPDSTPPEPGLRAISDVKQALQSNIDRSGRTISQFMQEKQIQGAVDLNATDDASSASNILTADQGRKYELGDVVARGGMGAIIDAKDANLRRSVAMKVVIDPKGTSKETILRFIQEAQVTSQLEHPSIVPVHELGVDASGNVFYTMKFVRGVTLKDVLGKIRGNEANAIRDYPLARLLNIFQKVCDAIAFAHSKRVVHRDLKPENIMIGDFGEVLVMDWGLAKVMPKKVEKPKKRYFFKGREPSPKKAEVRETDTPSINSLKNDLEHGDALKTMHGVIMGTPGYMAPEQALGRTEDIGPCTDIYALGAILYSILTLEPPVEGRSLAEVLQKVSAGNIPSPTSFNPKSSKAGRGVPGEPPSREHGSAGTPRPTEEKTVHPLPHLPDNLVPDSLSAVTMKALTLEPVNRYPTVQALQREIEAFQGGFATTAEQAGTWRLLQLFFQRHQTVAILGALALTGVVGGAIAATTQWIRAAEKERVARDALNALKDTAPALMTQARAYIEQGDASNAAKQASYAAELMPNSPEYLVFKGDMLECALKLNAAATAYEKALELLGPSAGTDPTPGQAARGGLPSTNAHDRLRLHAQHNLALCRKLLAENTKYLTPAAVTELHIAMRNQDRFAESFVVMRYMGRGNRTLNTMFKAILDKRGVKYVSLAVDNNGKCSLDLNGSGISDLRLLQGLPLTSLSLQSCPITDLSAVKDTSLTTLNLCDCRQITDLSPLKGMPLTSLNLAGCPVTDLSPLKGMPLTSLNLAGCPVTDLSPLKGMLLTSLNLQGAKVTDLSPLKGMPLR